MTCPIAKFLMADSCIQLRELARLFPYFVSRDLLTSPTSNAAVWNLNYSAVGPKRSRQADTAHHHCLVYDSIQWIPPLSLTLQQPPHPSSPAGPGRAGSRAGEGGTGSLVSITLSIANTPAFPPFQPQGSHRFQKGERSLAFSIAEPLPATTSLKRQILLSQGSVVLGECRYRT